MLVQLTNGDWITPTKVVKITYLPRQQTSSGSQLFIPDRVVVWMDDGSSTSIVNFENALEAIAYRDHLAELVNKSRTTPEPKKESK